MNFAFVYQRKFLFHREARSDKETSQTMNAETGLEKGKKIYSGLWRYKWVLRLIFLHIFPEHTRPDWAPKTELEVLEKVEKFSQDFDVFSQTVSTKTESAIKRVLHGVFLRHQSCFSIHWVTFLNLWLVSQVGKNCKSASPISQSLSTGTSEGNTFVQRFKRVRETFFSGFRWFCQAIARCFSGYHVV